MNESKDESHLRDHERLMAEGKPLEASDALAKYLAQGSAIKETPELLEESRIKDQSKVDFLNRTRKIGVS